MIQNFKSFVKENPIILNYIKSGEMTWQKFYEIYDMYGEDEKVWEPYLKKEEKTSKIIGLSDIVSYIKQTDLKSIEEGINSIQRVIGVLEDLSSNTETKNEYKPRPLYKHFED